MGDLDFLIKRKGAIYGLGLGAILLVLSLFLYYYKIKLTESFFMIAVGGDYIVWLLRGLIAALFCYSLRRKIGGYWTVRQATGGIFIMFIVTYAIQFIGNDIVFEKIIDKNVSINIRNAFENANKRLVKENKDFLIFKDREKKIDEKYPLIQKSVSISENIMRLLMAVIFIFIISLVFAGIFKRELIYK
ncbi:MAG: DUF4199 family protein [Mucilaginibacter sp.]